MNELEIAEQAYKNGYEAGVREFAERLKNCIFERDNDVIDTVANELTGKGR